jgi:glycosyltransferase involved in cell wall biosynthesis
VSARLSVLIVCQHDLTGPSEKQMMGFAQGLARRGHRVLFSFGAGGGAGADEGLELVDGIELSEHRFEGRRLRQSDRRRARAFGPDLIHVVNSRVPTVAAASDYVGCTGALPLVHFEDDEWNAWRGVPGESLYYRVGRRVRWVESAIHPASWPHSTGLTRHWVRRNAVALDALTPALATEVSHQLGRPCATLLPVSPEVRPAGAIELELPAALEGVPLVVVTGTIYPFSLEDTLQGLRAVAEVQRRGHQLGYVHPGNVHERIDPVALARDAGLAAGSFWFPGLVPYAAIEPLLARATVLLQAGGPTEFNRLRLPSKLQAYLASGTPTITFAVGFGELLADRSEVLKIETAEASELADRIAELLEDEHLRLALRDGGPRAARRLFDPDTNTDALEAHYRAALAGATNDAGGSARYAVAPGRS